MKTLRAITLVLTLFVISTGVRANDGVLMPGGDRTPPPPPPPVCAPDTTGATVAGEPAGDDENALLLYATAIWLQLRGISIPL